MKKVIALVTLLILAVGGYYLYSFLMRKSTAELWTLIPDDAFAIVEVRESDDEWDDYKESRLRNFLTEFSYYKRVKEKINYVAQSLENDSDYSLFDVLGDKTFLFSFHDSDDLGTEGILYLPIGKEDKLFIKHLKKKFKSNPAFLIRKQSHNKKKYNELHFLETSEILYFHEFHGVFIASFSKALLFKTLKGSLDLKNFQKSRIAKLKKKHEEDEIETKNVNVFIDYAALSEVLGNYVTKDVSIILKEIGNFAQYSFLGLELDDETATFSGFTTCSDSTINFLSVFDDQDAGKTEWLKMIPTNAITTNSFRITDPLAYNEKVVSHSWSHEESESSYTEFLDLITGQVLALNLLSSSGEVDKAFVYKTEDAGTIFRWLKEQSTDQVEVYADKKIGLLKKSDLVSQLHGSLYGGTEVNVFSVVGDFVILSSSLPALKEYLLNISSENTWKTSSVDKENFEDHFLESNYSFYINPKLAQKAIYDDLTTSGANLRDEANTSIALSQFFLLEFSFQGEKYYTDLVMKFNKEGEGKEVSLDVVEAKDTSALKTLFEYSSNTNFASRPYVVKNYLHRTREVLIQDENHVLRMIDHEGNERWSYPLDGAILDCVYEVDVFKNQKLQYLFATSKQIYILDRRGKTVDNFPIQLKKSRTIESLSLFDYENNKDYRIAITSGKEAYLFDIAGRNLEGWNPKEFDAEIQGGLSHLRVRGKDYIASFSQKGSLTMVNRRGKEIKGFPLDLGSKLVCNGELRAGSSNGKTYFYSLTKDGKAVISNLNAKITAEIILLGKSVLSLVENGEDVVAVSKDANHVYFQNLITNTILTINAIYSDNIVCQFYNISGKRHYIITDLDNKRTVIYNEQGLIVNKADLPSTGEIALLYSSAKDVYRIYLVEDKKFRLIEF